MAGIGSRSIALDKNKKSAFARAVKRVKKNEAKQQKPVAPSLRRGIIMLNHLPHGFFEKEIKGYFAQFGKVLRVRVGRSKKTGKSRGFAFVEFEFEEVAKIAAEAMNNYLMFERLIKCEVVSEDANARKLFRDRYIREDMFPKLAARKKQIEDQKRVLSPEESAGILLSRLEKVKEQNKKLAELGISYQFTPPPVDLESLQSLAVVSSTSEKSSPKKKRLSAKIKSPLKVDDKANGLKLETPKSAAGKKRRSSQMTPAAKSPLQKQSPRLARLDTKVIKAEADSTNSPLEKKKKLSVSASPKPTLPSFSPSTNKIRKSTEPLQDKPAAVQTPAGKKRKSSEGLKSTPVADIGKLVTPKSDKKKQETPKVEQKPQAITDETSKKKISPEKSNKFSPKLLRSKKTQEQSAPVNESKKAGKKETTSTLPAISPKLLRSRKSEAAASSKNKTSDVPKISPKMLRSRKSEAAVSAKGNSSDLPRISPKMLRSRKSEAANLTPMKNQTPVKQKKAGRKSVF